jgi:hypothetical protein
MEKKSIICSVFTFLMMLFSVTGFAQINTNGGFETWYGDTPAGWFGSHANNLSNANVIKVTTGAHSGNFACQLVNTGDGHKRFSTESIHVNDGNQYEVSFWVKGQGEIRVGLYDGRETGSGYGPYSSYHEINSTTYQHCVDTMQAAVTTDLAEFILSIRNTDADGEHLIVDDVVITPVTNEGYVADPIVTLTGNMHSENTYYASATVSMSADASASIYYTLDGTEPDASSTLYIGPFTVTTTTTLKAVAISGSNSSNVVTRNITIIDLDPLFFENFESGGATQMTVVNVSGTYAWTTGSHNGNHYALANAYNHGATETWLLTPPITPLDASGVILSFSNAKNYIGPGIQVKYSTNYNGGSPTSATWTDITSLCTFSNGSWTWAESGDIAIPGASSIYFAWVYTSEESSAAGWEIDNIMVLAGDSSLLTPMLTITEPLDGAVYSTLDTLHVGIDIQYFTLDTDGYLKIESNFLMNFLGTDVIYLNQMMMDFIPSFPLHPLPAGEFYFTASLVDLDSNALSPAVSVSATFTVVPPVLDAPVITAEGEVAPGDNTFYFNSTVTMTAANDAYIFYTTDGTTPTDNSTLYIDPFQITETTTIKAIAVKLNYQNSDVSTLDVTITAPTVATPVFTPVAGTYPDSVSVSLACTTDGAEIHYTIDGTEPTEASALYSAPIVLTATTTVKAKAFKTDWFASETATATYTVVFEPVLMVDATTLNFTSTQLTQTFTVSGAHLDNPISLTCSDAHFTLSPNAITNPNSNTVVTVTFDGTEPATGIVSVASGTLSAQVALAATAQLPAPVMTPATGEETLIIVTMSCTEAGAEIRYTTDGSEPTATSTLYAAPIVLDVPGSYTLKAIAMKTGWENSDVTIGNYTVFEPSSGDTIIYAVGFEADEGFVASNVYNNTTVEFTGADGVQWGTYYGTPSTNSHIVGDQSMQMRWYTSAPNNIGYTYTNFDLNNVTHVTFAAASSNGLNVNVSHSVDGGATFSDGEVFTLGSTANTFDYVVDETGSYDFVRLKFTIVLPETNPSSTSRVVIDSLVVFGIPGVIPTTLNTPVITPNEGFYYVPQTVSITCSDVDAVIRYTTDGSVPTENSTIYTAPFTVSTTTTIKAKAWKTGMTPSFVATTTISFPEQVTNIAAFKANASSSAQQIMSNVTFVFRSGHYMFVEDNSAALLIYDNSGVITNTYNEGDVIEAGLFGSYQLYNGMSELIPSHNANEATGTPVTVTPTVATVSSVINDYATVYESKLVRLNDVVFIDAETFVQNGDTMSIRDRFNTVDMEISAGDHADVIGFVSYSTTYGYQIYPRDNQDIIISSMETVATPEFNFYRSGEFYFMNITCATEGASIYYTIDNTNPDENSYEYTSDVPFYLNVHYYIKAIAMKEGMLNSEIAVYDYDPVGIVTYELRDNLTVYPNPAVDNVIISAKDNNLVIEKVELYNIYGQLLNSETVNGTRAEVAVGTLATGTYFAKVFTDKGITTMPVIRK